MVNFVLGFITGQALCMFLCFIGYKYNIGKYNEKQ